MRQHDCIDITFAKPEFGQGVQQPRSTRLTTAGSWWWSQKRLGSGDYQDIFAGLLHEQAARGEVHQVVLIGLDPVCPAQTRRIAKHNATVEFGVSAGQCGNATVHNAYLFRLATDVLSLAA
ncbi:hypothetical protein D3C73_911460 [compost metagenome]